MISAFTRAVWRMCHMNNRERKTNASQYKTVFHEAVAPDIPFVDYVNRIGWFYNIPKECFVLALEYINRLKLYKPEVELNESTAHRLVLSCIKVATKFIDDTVFHSTFYAYVVGLP